MFIVQISLLIVTFLSLLAQILSLMQIVKEVNPHPHCAMCQYAELSPSYSYLLFFLCHIWALTLSNESSIG